MRENEREREKEIVQYSVPDFEGYSTFWVGGERLVRGARGAARPTVDPPLRTSKNQNVKILCKKSL